MGLLIFSSLADTGNLHKYLQVFNLGKRQFKQFIK
jgi:hypothetical protein